MTYFVKVKDKEISKKKVEEKKRRNNWLTHAHLR